MLYVYYTKLFKMLVVKDIDNEMMEGGYYIKRSFESLCKKYGTPTKVFIRNGKVIGAQWDKIDTSNSSKDVWKVFQSV